jgi:transposase
MAAPYSMDIRLRVVDHVEAGASRHEAAEQFGIGASSAIRWMQLVEKTGNCLAKPCGGSVSPLEAHAAALLDIVREYPDLTLDEMVVVVCKRGISVSRSALWRFLDRHGVTYKKILARRRAGTSGRRTSAAALDPASRFA